MTNLLLGFAQITLLLTVSNSGGPATVREPSIEQVRLVCDQYCTCWRTRYQASRTIHEGRENLVCSSRRHKRLYYNGYYRKGPATGLGFESRSPVREFSFPF